MAVRKKNNSDDTQHQVLNFIKRYRLQNGIAPSMREIQDGVGLHTTSHVDYVLAQLEASRLITRMPGKARSIQIIQPRLHTSPLPIPVTGVIAAGVAIEIPATDFNLFDAEEVIDVSASLLPNPTDPYFILRVQGHSMIDAMVDDGDMVVLTPPREVRNGDMVAAWLTDPGATTLKKYYLEDGGRRVRLQPANPNPEYQPVIINDPQGIQIQGRVVAVLRRTW
jgi:repressor LexA